MEGISESPNRVLLGSKYDPSPKHRVFVDGFFSKILVTNDIIWHWSLVRCRSRFLVSDWETLAENILCIEPYLASGNQTYVALEHLPCILEFVFPLSLYSLWIFNGHVWLPESTSNLYITFAYDKPMGQMYVSGTQGIPKTDLLELVVSKHGTLFGYLNDGKSRWRDSKFKAYWYLAGNGWVAGGCWDDYY